MEFSEALLKRAAECETALADTFAHLEDVAFCNTEKVMKVAEKRRLI